MSNTSEHVLSPATPADAHTWLPPAMNGGYVRTEDLAYSQAPTLPTAEQFEQWEREGRESGFEVGKAEGLAQGLAEAEGQIQQRLALLDTVLTQLTQPLSDIEADAEKELLHLSVIIAQQLVRREIKQHPETIIGVIREALSVLPSQSVSVVVHLHPDDARLIRETLAPADQQYEWSIKENPLVTRGGCLIDTDKSHIDASVETRLTQLAASALSGARQADQADQTESGERD